MLTHRRNLIVEFFLLFIVLLVISLPAQAGGAVHKAKVIEHWTPERMNTAQPRDFFLDKKGKAYMGSRQHGFAAYDQAVKGQAVQGQETAADTSAPDISNRFPADGATIGDSSIFSANVSDSEFESDTGVRTVSFVIQYPAGNTESFRASNTSGDTWGISLQGFTNSPDSTGWAWWIEAKDRAKRGGHRTTSVAFSFDVNTGTPPVEPPTEPPVEPPSEGIIQNAQWTEGGAVQTAAGRIFFEMPGNSKRKGPWSGYVCSGTVVNDSDIAATETTGAVDNGRAIIITAAHCAYDDVNKAFARNVLFIPNQANTTGTRTDTNCDNDPLGCWTPRFAVVDTDWSSRTFPNNIPWDYAYYVVDDSDGDDDGNVSDAYSGIGLLDGVNTLQAAAGGMPLSFAPPSANDGEPGPTSIDYTHALGYSYSYDPNFMYCAEDMTTVDYKTNDTQNWWLSQCNLSGGSSGGPWLQPVTTGNGPINSVISVNSWGYTSGSGMAGPFLDFSSASCLYDLAESTDFSSINTNDGDAGIKAPCD